MSVLLLEMQQINKSFYHNLVLKDVDFSLHPGEVHALLGENGAGKSTLMKILNGIYQKDQGKILIQGKEVKIDSPSEAIKLGIAMIHQELNLVPELTVMENIYLGRESSFGKAGWISWKAMKQAANKWLASLGVNIEPTAVVGKLSIGQQQMVEIVKSLTYHAKILVLDEPTAALTNKEIETLFTTIHSLKRQGVGLIYISHRMEEIFEICDRITVLRDGKYVGTRKSSETTMDELVTMMVGREITSWYPTRNDIVGSERLRVEGLSKKGQVENITFTIKSGEILGVAGLMGSGRTEMADLLFGKEQMETGKIFIDGKEVQITQPTDAIDAGISYVTEDRKKQGLILSMSMEENLVLSQLAKKSKYMWINRKETKSLADGLIREMSIRPAKPDMEVGHLSGGNQQKVVMGKWLATKPKILILDEPTRGVDIGAKAEIYRMMNTLAKEGVSILFISSDLPEVLNMSDRIIVLYEGKMNGEFTRAEATQEKVMKAASGG